MLVSSIILLGVITRIGIWILQIPSCKLDWLLEGFNNRKYLKTWLQTLKSEKTMLPVSYSFNCCVATVLAARRFCECTGLVNPPSEPQHLRTGNWHLYCLFWCWWCGEVTSRFFSIFQDIWLLCWTLFAFKVCGSMEFWEYSDTSKVAFLSWRQPQVWRSALY